jgi:hypothetical protein
MSPKLRARERTRMDSQREFFRHHLLAASPKFAFFTASRPPFGNRKPCGVAPSRRVQLACQRGRDVRRAVSHCACAAEVFSARVSCERSGRVSHSRHRSRFPSWAREKNALCRDCRTRKTRSRGDGPDLVAQRRFPVILYLRAIHKKHSRGLPQGYRQ